MKKAGLFLAVLIISLVFASLLVYAQENTDVSTDTTTDTEGIKDVGTKIDTTLEKNIQVPENLQIPARIIFGVQGEIPLEILIVLIGIWIILFLIVSSILELTPFFEGAKAWVGGFVITCLIAITGAIRSMAIFFFHIGNIFSFLEWGIFNIIVALVILGILFYGASIILKIIKKKIVLAKAEMAGLKAGAGLKMFKKAYEFEKGGGI